MDKMLEITISPARDRRANAIATVQNFPGLHVDMTAAQLRGMAAALVIAARECETLPSRGKHFKRTLLIDLTTISEEAA